MYDQTTKESLIEMIFNSINFYLGQTQNRPRVHKIVFLHISGLFPFILLSYERFLGLWWHLA
jgi:hypothetical protein